jgi:DNA-binding ferritin-like protein (Dps family)
MNWTCITLHNEALDLIIDAAIPNKQQNVAMKRQIAAACDELMNRIANGWLEPLKAAANAQNQAQQLA